MNSTVDRLPTAAEVEQYLVANSKNEISLVVGNEWCDHAAFPVDKDGDVHLYVVVRRESDRFTYNPATNERIDTGKCVEHNWHVPMTALNGNFELYFLNVYKWADEWFMALNRCVPSPNYFRDIEERVLAGIEGINEWLRRHVVLYPEAQEPCDDGGYGSCSLSAKISGSNKRLESLPFIKKNTFGNVRFSKDLFAPSPKHPNWPVFEAALSYEKRTSERALREVSSAYSGHVNVERFLADERKKYIKALKATTPEFRAALALDGL